MGRELAPSGPEVFHHFPATWNFPEIKTLAHAGILLSSMQVSSKFGTCTVVGLNVTLVEAKMCTCTIECTHFTVYSTSVPLRPPMVQMPIS
jgi:hypothetical protein